MTSHEGSKMRLDIKYSRVIDPRFESEEWIDDTKITTTTKNQWVRDQTINNRTSCLLCWAFGALTGVFGVFGIIWWGGRRR